MARRQPRRCIYCSSPWLVPPMLSALLDPRERVCQSCERVQPSPYHVRSPITHTMHQQRIERRKRNDEATAKGVTP